MISPKERRAHVYFTVYARAARRVPRSSPASAAGAGIGVGAGAQMLVARLHVMGLGHFVSVLRGDRSRRSGRATPTTGSPAHLRSGDPLPFDPAQFALRNTRAVYDMIYRPAETPLLQRAKKSGCRTANGLGMLLYQGAAALEIWTGQAAPVAVMRAALEAGADEYVMKPFDRETLHIKLQLVGVA